MREILFRGKRVDNGEWVEGYYVKGAERHCIVLSLATFPRFDVIPETVGECTGVTDTIGRKIFEGDIIKCTRIYDVGCYPFFKTEIHEVVYREGCFTPFYDCERNSFEIIGNVCDNPELMGEV